MPVATAPTLPLGISAEMVLVTPEVAKKMLAKNTHNRPENRQHVHNLARDMRSGLWNMTGEPIKFSDDDVLLDGQHRLAAIVLSGISYYLLVIRGLERAAQAAMDTGQRRTAGNALHLNGYNNTQVLSGAARLAMAIEAGQPNARFSNGEVLAYVQDHPELVEAAKQGNTLRHHLDSSGAVLAIAWVTFARIDGDAATDFFHRLSNNITTGTGDPLNTLLKRLTSARRHDEKVPMVSQLAMYIRTWNAVREGKPLHNLKVRAATNEGTAAVSLPKAV